MTEIAELKSKPLWWRRRWCCGRSSSRLDFIAFFFTWQIYFTTTLGDRPLLWTEVAREQFIYPYMWAL